MPKQKIDKVHASRVMLDRALALLLDEGDYISAIVLAGSAEDVLHDLLERFGAKGARSEFVEPVQRLYRQMHPDDPPLTDGNVHSIIRLTFNWLRHASSNKEPPEIEIDLRADATMAAMRAVDNFWNMTRTEHPRKQELLDFYKRTTDGTP